MSSHEFDDVPGEAGEPVDPFAQLDAAIALWVRWTWARSRRTAGPSS